MLFVWLFECDGYISCAYGCFESGRIVDPANRRIAVGRGEGFIEKHQAVVAIEHQVAATDGSGTGWGGRE